jgi:hypothetical protein
LLLQLPLHCLSILPLLLLLLPLLLWLLLLLLLLPVIIHYTYPQPWRTPHPLLPLLWLCQHIPTQLLSVQRDLTI